MIRIFTASEKIFSFVIIIYILFFLGSYHFTEKKYKNRSYEKIMKYIAEHEGQDFNFLSAAKNLNLSYKSLKEQLFILEKNGLIKVTPKYMPRKPIVISSNDSEWYFGKIDIVKD